MHLPWVRGHSPRWRQGLHHGQAAAGGVGGGDRSAPGLDESANHRQAQSDPGGVVPVCCTEVNRCARWAPTPGDRRGHRGTAGHRVRRPADRSGRQLAQLPPPGLRGHPCNRCKLTPSPTRHSPAVSRSPAGCRAGCRRTRLPPPRGFRCAATVRRAPHRGRCPAAAAVTRRPHRVRRGVRRSRSRSPG
jgi:hypothetical protein